MSSSRSGATVRAKRTTTPAEYGRPQSSPVTSIHSQQIFNSGANTTGVNARINGASGATTKNVTTPSQQQQQQQYSSQPGELYNPPPGSKLTIGNAVALITLRLGRLESFMNQYNLEEPNGNDSNNDIMQTVLARISALEQKATIGSGAGVTASKTAGVDVNQSLLNRVVALEKNSDKHFSNFQVMSDGLKNIENSLHELSKMDANPNMYSNSTMDSIASLNDDVNSVKNTFHSFSEELTETKNLLLKLQSFTMETNAKLVNTIFSQVDQFDIQEFENDQDEMKQYMCGTFGEDGFNEVECIDDEEGDEDGVEEASVTDADTDANEITSGGIQVNFKEMISQELLGIVG